MVDFECFQQVESICFILVVVRQISCTQVKSVDAVRNPSDFSKIEYAVPKSMVGRILGKGICQSV